MLHAALRARRAEIEAAIWARIDGYGAPAKAADPEYARGLREAVSAAVGHALETVEVGEERVPPAPPELLAQARRSARAGVGLDTVLRRYFAGHALFSDFLVEEAGADGGLSGERLQRLLSAQASVLDRIAAEVSAEHARETERLRRSSKRREAERIERLLAGERPETSRIAYDFEAHHLGLVVKGPGARDALRELAGQAERNLLAVGREEEVVWAWLGGREPLELSAILSRVEDSLPPETCLATGEPGEGIAGWRRTHRQAKAALPVALAGSEPLVRYADVALLAAILQDELLADSLHRIYLAPLEAEGVRGETLRETLRAYFTAGRSVSSAAAALGVNRHTVSDRLRAIEKSLGRPLESCAVELQAALRIDQFGSDGGRKPATSAGRRPSLKGDALR